MLEIEREWEEGRRSGGREREEVAGACDWEFGFRSLGLGFRLICRV